MSLIRGTDQILVENGWYWVNQCSGQLASLGSITGISMNISKMLGNVFYWSRVNQAI